MTDKHSKKSSPLTVKGVIVDIGTGDGRFVYQSARHSPNRLYIGIDASTAALEKVSQKIHRKPAKGGLNNALYVQAAVEDLPEDLNGVADEVHIHFPWGSLLGAVAKGEPAILAGIRRICARQALLEVIIGVDSERDRTELERLGVPLLTLDYIDSTLLSRYRKYGFEIRERGEFPADQWPNICTTWAQKLRSGNQRTLLYFIAQAI